MAWSHLSVHVSLVEAEGIDCLVCNAGAMTPKRTAVVTKYWLYSGFKTQIKFRLQLVQKQRPIRNSVGFILAVFASSSWPSAILWLKSLPEKDTYIRRAWSDFCKPFPPRDIFASCLLLWMFFFFFCLPQVVRRMKDLGLSRGESPCIILYHPVFCKIVLFNWTVAGSQTQVAQTSYACRLSQELRPLIKKNEGRVVAVSSGGMLNVKYDHGYATGAKGSYDKQLSYAYAKRAQVPRCAAIGNRLERFLIEWQRCKTNWLWLQEFVKVHPDHYDRACKSVAGVDVRIFGQSAGRADNFCQLPSWLDRYAWCGICLWVTEACLQELVPRWQLALQFQTPAIACIHTHQYSRTFCWEA